MKEINANFFEVTTRRLLLIGIAFFFTGNAFAQNDSTSKVVIEKIVLIGNKKTKDYIILREIPFSEHDTLNVKDVPAILLKAKENIYNTKLFISVDILAQKLSDNNLALVINLKERWYTFPWPYVELADRSLNVWLHTYNADLRRLSYGIYFVQENLTGRADNLEVKAIAGFNRELSAEYTTPYLTSGLSSKLRFGGGVLASKEIPYRSTLGNKLLYHQGNTNMKNEWYATIGILSRKKIKKREWLTFMLRGISIADSIASFYNPDFFGNGKKKVVFPQLSYKFRYDDVDNVMYPLNGHSFEAVATKRGLGWKGDMDLFSVFSDVRYYVPLGHNFFSEWRLAGEIKIPFEQPYYNQKLLGYGDNYIRGLEYYVIDGYAFWLGKLDVKKKILFFELPTFLKSKNYSKIPFTLYAKVYGDVGNAYSHATTTLGNRLQYSGGFGLDIVTIYDLALKLEFSFNRLGESGLFLHR